MGLPTQGVPHHGASAFTGFAHFGVKLALMQANDKRAEKLQETLMIVFGKTETSKEPWLTIGASSNRTEMFRVISDLKKLEAARKCKDRIATIKDCGGKVAHV